MVTCKDCPYWKSLKVKTDNNSVIGECYALPNRLSQIPIITEDAPACFIYHADKFIKEHFKQDEN